MNNIKVIVDEANNRCEDVKKLSNDSKNQYGELMKELRDYCVSQGINNVKNSDKGGKKFELLIKAQNRKTTIQK